jgi:hypothetical protein
MQEVMAKKYAKLNLTRFEKKIRVRRLRKKDFDTIVEMQHLCFLTMHPWTVKQYKSMLKLFPEGQICVEVDGRIAGSASSCAAWPVSRNLLNK